MISTYANKYKKSPNYSNFPTYTADDLGVNYSPQQTTFRLWSPIADEVVVRLYNKGLEGKVLTEHNMKRDVEGTWLLVLEGDWKNLFYTFQVRIDGNWLKETTEIYARAAGANGERAAIVNLAETNPIGWESDTYIENKNYTDVILYEVHLRDISANEESGAVYKGKFLSLTESHTSNENNAKTGLDHLQELGITHVHLLPCYDFVTVDETKPNLPQYNWGYDPQNYNVPEGSYSTDAFSPTTRIREFKEMVKALHSKGIGVIMDVVYNHTYHTEASNFNQLVPGYYYRFNYDGTFSNASGCGNELATGRPMVRRYIIDSLKYWASEYHIDGFRFDLMGIFDIDTMNQIQAEIKKINPSTIIYGEGWTAADSVLPFDKRAVKQHVRQLNEISMFNDNFRDAIKGPWWNHHEGGFISGREWQAERIKQGIVGSTHHPQLQNHHDAWAAEPSQTINYFSCHDNHTLWDSLKIANYGAGDYDLIQMTKLAYSILLTSQGIPFLLAGEEFVRSKKGNHNSYNSPDDINEIQWANKSKYQFLYDYCKNLIHLRRKHPAFRMSSKEMVEKHLRFLDTVSSQIIAYEISDNANGDSWKTIIVIFNSSRSYHSVSIPDGYWVVVANSDKVCEHGIETIEGGRILLRPISTLILAGK